MARMTNLTSRDDDHHPGFRVLTVIPSAEDPVHVLRQDSLVVHLESDRQNALRSQHRQSGWIAELLDEDGRAATAEHPGNVVEAVCVSVGENEIPV